MALIAANFAHQENGVQHNAGDQNPKEENAENQGDDFVPVEHRPSGRSKQRRRHQAGAQSDEEGDGSAATGFCIGSIKSYRQYEKPDGSIEQFH